MLLSRLCSSTSSSMTACAVRPSANGAAAAGTGLDGAVHASPTTRHSAFRCPVSTASPRTSPGRGARELPRVRGLKSPERVRLCVAPSGRIGDRVGGGGEASNTCGGRKAEPRDAPPLPCASAAVLRLGGAAAGKRRRGGRRQEGRQRRGRSHRRRGEERGT